MKWLALFFFLFSFNCSSLALNTAREDILVFSPHPDDETLACGGTILKNVRENKKIKVIFLTNGEAYEEACSLWFKKKSEKLFSSEYIAFGLERQKEALEAIKKLGLKESDAIFLSYPDKGLLPIWEEAINYGANYKNYKSLYTKQFVSPFQKTYNRASQGYNRQNLILDIRDILSKYRPKKIYSPHPQDAHKDHQATVYSVNLALEKLRGEENSKWLDSTSVYYYFIHSLQNKPGFAESPFFSEKPSVTNIAGYKNQKKSAFKRYFTQQNLKNKKDFFDDFINEDEEKFYVVSLEKEAYLKKLEEEWLGIARYMRNSGFNLNFAPVADVAGDIEDLSHPLTQKQRMYSQDPQIVTELISAVCGGLMRGGIIPVVKHFPGLGSVYADTHFRLPRTAISKAELDQKDLVPFKEIIRKYPDIWVMIDHGIYSSLSDEPASLSYEIQTKLLREELGFKGIIVVDELLRMEAMAEYAAAEKISQPHIGELVVRAFQAGSDLAIIYLSPQDAKEVSSSIIKAVTKAVGENRIQEKEINQSVARIVRAKEKVFGTSLQHLLKEMPLEEKICQKLIFDWYKNTEIFKKYNFGGIRFYNRDKQAIAGLQKNGKIPAFIIFQHEGGKVSQYGIFTRSAYAAGKEYERIIAKNELRRPRVNAPKNQVSSIEQEANSLSFRQLDQNSRKKIFSLLLSSMDKLIVAWSENKQKNALPYLPNFLSPLTYSEENLQMKLFKDLPASWLRGFPEPQDAGYAYQLLKEVFDNWIEGQRTLGRPEEIIFQLFSLREEIRNYEIKKDKSFVRVLCLAVHPDDEDAEALAYFGKRFNCQTFILSATRGEGGENDLDSSLYDELGVLRVREMESSASLLGVKKVYYLGKNDFGYSSSLSEVYEKWGKEDTLKRLVYFIRLIRPQIIITKHNKFDNSGHAQHRALAILAEEAFNLAGNSKAYPEMKKEGIFPWQPLKFYQRWIKEDYLSDKTINKPSDFVFLADSACHKIAIEALSQHQSQGDWRWLESGKAIPISYQLAKTKVFLKEEDSFFEGIKEEPSLAAEVAVKCGIPQEPLINPSQGKLAAPPLVIPGVKIIKGLRIGIVEKNNNVLSVALKTLGYDFKNLDQGFLQEGDLSRFQTIVLGQNSFITFPIGVQLESRLLEFVRNGGNLVIFSQRPDARNPFARPPCNINISMSPVSDENTPLEILRPEHPLFNFPNKVSYLDFSGWQQERALYLPFKYSDDFLELTRCLSDSGKVVKGGYLAAHFGGGSCIYAGYSWYRQFRVFLPGAYKNFSNMLAYRQVLRNEKK